MSQSASPRALLVPEIVGTILEQCSNISINDTPGPSSIAPAQTLHELYNCSLVSHLWSREAKQRFRRITTAAQRALLTPAILDVIFEELILEDGIQLTYEDQLYPDFAAHSELDRDWRRVRPFGGHIALRHCALVSQLWFKHAIPFLWQQPFKIDRGILPFMTTTFRNIDAGRRQMYADLIRYGVHDMLDTSTSVNPLLDLRFPKLVRLHLYAASSEDLGLDGSNVNFLELDHDSLFWGTHWPGETEATTSLLLQLSDALPNLTHIEGLNTFKVLKPDLDKFEASFPHLEHFYFDAELVDGTEFSGPGYESEEHSDQDYEGVHDMYQIDEHGD